MLHDQIAILFVLVARSACRRRIVVLLIIAQRPKVVEILLTYLVGVRLHFGKVAAERVDQGLQGHLSDS